MRSAEQVDTVTREGWCLHYSLFAVALLPFYFLPVWGGMFINEYGFSTTQTGILLSADMAAGTIASLAARFWIHRIAWRPVLLLSILVATISNLACIGVSGFNELLCLRGMAGFAAGTMMALPYAAFSSFPNPDREFSLALGLQVCLGALALLAIPAIESISISRASFLFCACFSFLPLFLIRQCPNFNPGIADAEEIEQGKLDFFLILALLAVGFFFLALTAVWVFMEQLGQAGGIQSPVVASILALGLLFSFIGALSPALAIQYLNRSTMIWTAYLFLFIALAGTGWHTSLAFFATAIVIYNFFYSFIIPLQTAWIAESDRSGRNAVLIPLAQGVGVSLGPIAAGLVSDRWGSASIVVMSLLFLLLSLSCYLIASSWQRTRLN